MKNLYQIQRDDQQRRVDAFLHKYAFFAFSKDQFSEGLQRLGLTETDAGRLVRIFGGGFLLREKAADFKNLMSSLSEERRDALKQPETGRQFARDMFYTELLNHEFTYTGDSQETLEALGYTLQEVREDPVLNEAFDEAIQLCFKGEAE